MQFGFLFYLLSLCTQDRFSPDLSKAYKMLWKSAVPSKFIVFGWKVLHRRIVPKVALQHRGILLANVATGCVFCSIVDKDSDNFLFSFSFAYIYKVWTHIYSWMGVAGAYPNRIYSWKNVRISFG